MSDRNPELALSAATAVAHPNIALVKYWGKQGKPGNIPATPNLSITLGTLRTETTVKPAETDQITLNGKVVGDPKISQYLATLRDEFPIPPLSIDSKNNFPTGAGLASSASGFAALTHAIDALCGLDMDPETQSGWARQGSASAARSLMGGYVALTPPMWMAQQLAPAEHWPLAVVVAICDTGKKSVGSTEGMQRSRATSPFFSNWVENAADDFANASDAIAQKDFAQLAAVSELSCLKMHSVMLTSQPTLAYWLPATIAAMECIRQLRSNGTPVFFTIDAGPQVKAVCLPEAVNEVAEALANTAGVLNTLRCSLGPGAYLVE